MNCPTDSLRVPAMEVKRTTAALRGERRLSSVPPLMTSRFCRSRSRARSTASAAPAIAAADLGQLHALHVVPDALIAVQVGRVAGQLLQVHPFGRPAAQDVFDRLPAMDKRAAHLA